MSDWKGMDTAPKDGSEFLVRYPLQGNVKKLCNWDTIHHLWESKGESFSPESQQCEWLSFESQVARIAELERQLLDKEGVLSLAKCASNSALMNLKVVAKQRDELSATVEKLRDTLTKVDKLERKMSDAWCGGIGYADLVDLGSLGKIVRRVLTVTPAQNLAAVRAETLLEAAKDFDGRKECKTCGGPERGAKILRNLAALEAKAAGNAGGEGE